MAKIPKTTPTVEFRADDWEAHEHVVARTYLGNHELQVIQDAALAARGTPGSSDAILQHQLAAAGLAMLKAGVVSWTITYEDGSPLPCTEEGMKMLPPKYAKFIRDELQSLWSAWDPQVEKKAEAARPATEEEKKAEAATRQANFPLEQGRPRRDERHAHAGAGAP